jgi:hypothetical protein
MALKLASIAPKKQAEISPLDCAGECRPMVHGLLKLIVGQRRTAVRTGVQLDRLVMILRSHPGGSSDRQVRVFALLDD